MIRAITWGLAAGFASTVIDDTMVRIAGVAAGVAGAIYLTKTVFVPFGELMHRALTGWKALDALADWMRETRLDIAEVKERLDVLEHKAAVAQEAGEAIVRDLGIAHRAPPELPGEPPAAA